MSALKDLTGKVFGLLTVIERGPNDKHNKPQYWCLCACGNPELVLKPGNALTEGKIKSCGCLRHNRPKKPKIKKKTQIELQREERTDMLKYNKSGDLMKIVEYHDSNNVIIEFQDEFRYQMKVIYGNFIKGTIKNPYHRILYGRGYLGVGEYMPSINRKATPAYDAWRKMFDRCYSEYQEETYKDCQVCEEWYDFQKFAEWYQTHFWNDLSYPMQIDKDWLQYDNKIYCPEYCEIVPSIINSCLIRHGKTKYENDIPANIQITASGKYKPRLSEYGKRVDLGTYDDLIVAMKVYKNEKIRYIQEIANRYKNYISDALYQSMMNYEQRLIKELPEYAEI